jgi:hypothetical protein
MRCCYLKMVWLLTTNLSVLCTYGFVCGFCCYKCFVALHLWFSLYYLFVDPNISMLYIYLDGFQRHSCDNICSKNLNRQD